VRHRSRTVSNAGVVAIDMAILAVCPCPAMAEPAGSDPHACCAGTPGLKAAPPGHDCCVSESRETLAISTLTADSLDGWSSWDAAPLATQPRPTPPLAHAYVPPRAAPPVLRI
jgi:hypothetical protein